MVEQHRALADDAEAIDRGEPVVAVGDRRRRPAEHPDVAGLRQDRPGDEIREHFGGDLIEAHEGDMLAGLHAEGGDPQRTQGAVVFDDARELENRGGHDLIWRLTSSTTPLEMESAEISVFSAATLHAIAP